MFEVDISEIVVHEGDELNTVVEFLDSEHEHWKLAEGGNAIEATVTIDDPGTFNAPWSGLVRWTKLNGPLMESNCAENNENYGKFLGLREYPMPEANTPDF